MGAADDDTLASPTEPAEKELLAGQIVGGYRIERRLGAGGMGVVYRAVDTRLGRAVALKLLSPGLAGDATALARFAREARAAGALQHENVIAVYEVGEHHGLPFIAMALHEGETLRERIARGPADALSCARILVQIANALAAAHAAGVVHRDVKPGNVMLGADGKIKLVDFGVAKLLDVRQGTLTASGELVGTLLYMAPEQHRGRDVGPAADLWAVGVVGYEMLSGTLPFNAPSTASLVEAIVHDDPPPLHRGDLETILLKCLAKEPERRYPSANALAEDLQRFSAGQTITGRRASLSQRLRRRARRHRAALLVAAAGVVGMLGLGGWLLQSRAAAAARTRRAQALGQRVQQLRSQMRAAHLLPLHDTRPDRERVRVEMRQVETEMRALGDEGRGAAELALGAGLFSLGERHEARPHLEAAWAAGERQPELAYALGLALAEEYTQQLHYRSAARAAEVRKLIENLRDPALRFLRLAGGATDLSPAYVEALIAFYEERFDVALERARAAFAETPSLYEAARLSGESYHRLEVQAWRRGDGKQAQALAAQAEAAFTEAIDVARSDDSTYLAFVDWLTDQAQNIEAHLNGDGSSLRRRAIELCERARRANSEADWTDGTEAEVLYYLADRAFDQKLDARPDLERALTLAKRAVAEHPQRERNWQALSWAHLLAGRHGEAQRGIDPLQSLAQSAAASERAAQLAPDDASNYVNLSVSHSAISEWQMQHGEDATVEGEATVGGYERALRVDPAVNQAHFNACAELLDLANARVDRGQDPDRLLERARPHCQAAHAAEPQLANPVAMEAALDSARARYLFASGRDPRPALKSALAKAEQALALPSADVAPHEIMSELLRLAATVDAVAGQDAQPLIDRALEEGHQANRITGAQRDIAWIASLMLDARERLRARRDVQRPLARALAAAAQALRDAKDDVETQLVVAEIELVAAVAKQRARQPATGPLRDGALALERVLGVNPRAARALAIRARLQRISGDGAAADASLAAAVAANPFVRSDPALTF